MNNAPKNQGLIGLIIMLIIAILVLSYFGISIKSVATSDTAQSNFGYVKSVIVDTWNNYFRDPFNYVYHNIWIDLLWHPFVTNINNINSGRPTTIEPPTINLQN